MSESADAPSATVSDARVTITFSNPIPVGRTVDYLTVLLEGPDMVASRQVYAGWREGFATLGRYLGELGASWRGWEGERVFESVEGDLRLTATHDGHVRMDVILEETTVPDGWRVQAAVRLDAGEQLATVVRDVIALVGR